MKKQEIHVVISFSEEGDIRDKLNRSFLRFLDSELVKNNETAYYQHDEEPLISGGAECIPR